jgi:hypothetical protein
MSARVLFIVGGMLLGAFLVVLSARAVLGLGGGGPATPTPTPTATGFAIIVPPISSILSGPLSTREPIAVETETTPAPTPTGLPTATAKVLIQADWPPEIAEGNSDTVAVQLIQTREEIFVAHVVRDGQTAVPATLVPRGTPEVPYTQSYGPDYKLVAASATLASANIDIVPVGEAVQAYSLDEARLAWYWNISPRKQGKQVMIAEVRFRWESDSGEPPKEHAVWQYTLDTLVGPPQGSQAISIGGSPGAQPQSAQSDPAREQVGFWADALSLVTGLGAVVAFSAGAVRWGVDRSKGLWKGTGA